MSTATASTLARLLGVLIRKAGRSGEVERMDLKGGARLIVRVEGDVVTLTIARKSKPVGDRELITFKNQFSIPADALRYPKEGQTTKKDGENATWHAVTFRWGNPL